MNTLTNLVVAAFNNMQDTALAGHIEFDQRDHSLTLKSIPEDVNDTIEFINLMPAGAKGYIKVPGWNTSVIFIGQQHPEYRFTAMDRKELITKIGYAATRALTAQTIQF